MIPPEGGLEGGPCAPKGHNVYTTDTILDSLCPVPNKRNPDSR